MTNFPPRGILPRATKENLVGKDAGIQVCYVPDHADSEGPWHKDAQFGFITSVKDDLNVAFCRYWNKDPYGRTLRTRANSEPTPIENLVLFESTEPWIIEACLERIKRGEM